MFRLIAFTVFFAGCVTGLYVQIIVEKPEPIHIATPYEQIICVNPEQVNASAVYAETVTEKPEKVNATGLDDRIIGGKPVHIKDYPFQISLRYYGNHVCGGSVYKADAIITAAHCLHDRNLTGFTIHAGTSFRNKTGVVGKIAKIISHPKFNIRTIENDIAILILEHPFNFTDRIQPISLASFPPDDGSEVYVSGWGLTSLEGSYPYKLRAVAVKIVNHDKCQKDYGKFNITSTMLCAGVSEGGKDACSNDSGGPLVQVGQAGGSKKLVGIVSIGRGCGDAKYPGVYTNVALLKPWIQAMFWKI